MATVTCHTCPEPGMTGKIVILGTNNLHAYGTITEMVTVLMFNDTDASVIETVHAADFLHYLPSTIDHVVPAETVLAALISALSNSNPCAHPYGKWIQSMKTAYEFADNLAVLVYNASHDREDLKAKIKGLKLCVSVCSKENMPSSRVLLNRLCSVESMRRLHERKASVIQSYWRKSVSNPNMYVCRRRLLREFEDMVFP